MAEPVVQFAFSGGLWDERFQLRSDLDRYAYACEDLTNFDVEESGKISRRRAFKSIWSVQLPSGVDGMSLFKMSLSSGGYVLIGVIVLSYDSALARVSLRFYFNTFSASGVLLKSQTLDFAVVGNSLPSWNELRFKQVQDEVYIVCGSFYPIKLVLDRVTDDFVVQKIDFSPMPTEKTVEAESAFSFTGVSPLPGTEGFEPADSGTGYKRDNLCFSGGYLTLPSSVMSRLEEDEVIVLFPDLTYSYTGKWVYGGGELFYTPAMPVFENLELKSLQGGKWAGTCAIETSLDSGQTWTSVVEVTAPVEQALYPSTTTSVSRFNTLGRAKMKSRQKGQYQELNSSSGAITLHDQDTGFQFEFKTTSPRRAFYFVHTTYTPASGNLFDFLPDRYFVPGTSTVYLTGIIYSDYYTMPATGVKSMWANVDFAVAGDVYVIDREVATEEKYYFSAQFIKFKFNTASYVEIDGPGISYRGIVSPGFEWDCTTTAAGDVFARYYNCQKVAVVPPSDDPNTRIVVALAGAPASFSTKTYALGALAFDAGYPRTVESFQSRLWLVGTNSCPQTIWASKTNHYYDFFVDSLATSALNIVPNVNSFDKVCWIKTFKDNLIVGSRTSELVLSSGSSSTSAISNTTASVSLQTSYGSYEHDAVVSGDSIYFIKGDRCDIMQQNYVYTHDQYNARGCCDFIKSFLRSDKIKTFATRDDYPSVLYAVTDGNAIYRYAFNEEMQFSAWSKYVFAPSVEVFGVLSFQSGGGNRTYVVAKSGQTLSIAEESDVYDADTFFTDGGDQPTEFAYTSTLITHPVLYAQNQVYGRRQAVSRVNIYGRDIADCQIKFHEDESYKAVNTGFDLQLNKRSLSGEISLPVDSGVVKSVKLYLTTSAPYATTLYGWGVQHFITN